MQPEKILIVEDEVLIADSISRNLRKYGYKVVGIAPDYHTAIEYIESKLPTIAIIDIKIKGNKSGIDLAHYLSTYHGIPFVFLTSHLDAATVTAAKHTRPSGYLTKPFTAETLYTTLEIAINNAKENNESLEAMNIRTGNETVKVYHKDIVYIEADHVYLHIVTTHKTLLSRMALREIKENLPAGFVQIHRSYIINTKFLLSQSANEVKLLQYTLPVSRSYRDNLIDL